MRGVIYDLDGTLMDSRLDFDAMRDEMGLPPGQPILETLETLESDLRQRCDEILKRHESKGADLAAPFDGVPGRGRTCGTRPLARLAASLDR